MFRSFNSCHGSYSYSKSSKHLSSVSSQFPSKFHSRLFWQRPGYTRALTTSTDNGNTGGEPSRKDVKLVWLDLEMTGLNIEKDTILEAACVITDKRLNILAEGPEIVIQHTQEQLDNMGEWCQTNHTENGLISKARSSTITLPEAQEQLCAFITDHVPYPTSGYLTGNSIHVDRMFLAKYMPDALDLLSHRIVDVTSIALLCSSWYPSRYRRKRYQKKAKHRALDDIRESIRELKVLKKNFFDVNPIALAQPVSKEGQVPSESNENQKSDISSENQSNNNNNNNNENNNNNNINNNSDTNKTGNQVKT